MPRAARYFALWGLLTAGTLTICVALFAFGPVIVSIITDRWWLLPFSAGVALMLVLLEILDDILTARRTQ